MENPTWGLMNQGNSAHSPSFKHIPKGNLYEVLDAFISGISTSGRSENIWRYGWMRVLKTWGLLIPQNWILMRLKSLQNDGFWTTRVVWLSTEEILRGILTGTMMTNQWMEWEWGIVRQTHVPWRNWWRQSHVTGKMGTTSQTIIEIQKLNTKP
jgi:hypothetical protein